MILVRRHEQSQRDLAALRAENIMLGQKIDEITAQYAIQQEQLQLDRNVSQELLGLAWRKQVRRASHPC